MRRQRAGVRRLALVATGSLLFAACGGDDDGGFGIEPPAEDEPTGDDGSVPDTERSARPTLDGNWAPTPGQADAIESALTGRGYECSTQDHESLDIRMCAKGVETTDEFGSELSLGRLRFVADDQGTVVMAAIDGNTAVLIPPAWEAMEAEMVEALLPPEDAAVLLADGTTLDWGTVERGQLNPDDTFVTIAGFAPSTPFVPDGLPFTTTIEELLPSLQAAGLECTFAGQPGSGTDPTGLPETGEEPRLSCLDPGFTSDNDDGSIEGATAEVVLVDPGTGIARLSVEARHGSVPDDLRGLRELLPKVVAALDQPPLPEVQGWVESHLDGLPHSAYIGTWQATLYVATSSTFGDSVSLHLITEQSYLGAPSHQN